MCGSDSVCTGNGSESYSAARSWFRAPLTTPLTTARGLYVLLENLTLPGPGTRIQIEIHMLYVLSIKEYRLNLQLNTFEVLPQQIQLCNHLEDQAQI